MEMNVKISLPHKGVLTRTVILQVCLLSYETNLRCTGLLLIRTDTQLDVSCCYSSLPQIHFFLWKFSALKCGVFCLNTCYWFPLCDFSKPAFVHPYCNLLRLAFKIIGILSRQSNSKRFFPLRLMLAHRQRGIRMWRFGISLLACKLVEKWLSR